MVATWGTDCREARVEGGKQKGEDNDIDKFFSSETMLRNNQLRYRFRRKQKQDLLIDWRWDVKKKKEDRERVKDAQLLI